MNNCATDCVDPYIVGYTDAINDKMCVSPYNVRLLRNLFKNMRYMQGYSDGAAALFQQKEPQKQPKCKCC